MDEEENSVNEDGATPINVGYFMAFEHLNEYVRESVEQKHFVEAVVLIHTTIEMYLSSVLEYAFMKKRYDDLKRRIVGSYRFINLARICYLLDLIDMSTYRDLLEMNKIRDSFAHQDIKWGMTERELKEKCEKWLRLNEKIFKLAVKLHEKSKFKPFTVTKIRG